MAQGCTSILLPLLIVDLGGKAKEVGLIIGLYTAASMVGTVLWARLSDTLKKRKGFILLGFLGTSLSYFALSIAPSLQAVLVVQVFFAMIIAAEIPVSTVYILRSTTKHEWDDAIGRFNQIGGWAWVVGLAMGVALLIFLSIRNLFIFNGMISSIAFILGYRYLRETPVEVYRKRLPLYFTQILEHTKYLPNYLIHIPRIAVTKVKEVNSFLISVYLILMASGLIFTPMVPYLKMLGAGATLCFVVSFLHSTGSALFYRHSGKIISTKSPLKILNYGVISRVVLSLFLVLIILINVSMPLIVFIYAMFGVTWSYILIPLVSHMSKIAPEDKESGAFGAFNFFYSFGLLTGSLLSGVLVDYLGYEIDLVFAVVLFIVAVLNLRNSKDEMRNG